MFTIDNGRKIGVKKDQFTVLLDVYQVTGVVHGMITRSTT